MARRRQTVEPLQEAVRPTPQAAPVDTFAAPGRVHQSVIDLAPLSEAVQGYLKDQAKEDARKKIQAGEKFVLEHPELVREIETEAAEIKDAKAQAKRLKDDFAFAQRAGIIPPAADPYTQIGYARASARLLAGAYAQAVEGRLKETSQLRGPDGLPMDPVNPDAILAEEWAKIQDSPALQNFYGAEEALATKSQVDERFRAGAMRARNDALETDYRQILTQDIGTRFDQILADNPVVDSVTLQPLTEFLTTEVHGHNVQNPRELVIGALELSFQRLAAIDPDEALRAVHAAQDLVVEGTPLGDDRGEAGQRLQTLTQRVQEQARDASLRELQTEDAKRRLAIQQGQGEYVDLLVRAKQEGQSLPEIARRLSEQIMAEDEATGKYGGRGAFVVDDLNDMARNMDAARQSDQLVVDQVTRLVALGQLEDADQLATASLGAGLTGQDFARLKEAIGQRKATTPLVEESPVFRGTLSRYKELKPQGYAPAVQQRIDDQIQQLEIKLTQDYATLMQTEGAPNRAWLEERWAADSAAIRQLETETRGKRDESEAHARQLMARFQDAGPVIDQAERTGTFTLVEAQQLREQNVQASAGREALLRPPELGEAEAALNALFVAQGADVESPEGLTLLEASRQELRDRYTEAVDKVLGDEKTDPRSYRERARAELRRVQREMKDQLFPTEVDAQGDLSGAGTAQAETALKEGKSVDEVEARRTANQADFRLAASLSSVVADPRARESLTDRDPYFQTVRSPDVPEDFYRYAAAWQSGLDPVFGTPVRRSDVELKALKALQALPEEGRSDAAASIASVLGIDPTDVLQDRLVLEPSQEVRALVEREIEVLTGPMAWLPFGLRDEQIAQLRKQIEPVKVDMAGTEWRPYTTPFFRTPEAFAAFADDPAWPDFLRKVGITPEDAAEVRAFEDAQIDAITRTNP